MQSAHPHYSWLPRAVAAVVEGHAIAKMLSLWGDALSLHGVHTADPNAPTGHSISVIVLTLRDVAVIGNDTDVGCSLGVTGGIIVRGAVDEVYLWGENGSHMFFHARKMWHLELERAAAVTATVASYNIEIAPLRERLAELERIPAGEQVVLFPNALKAFAVNDVGDVEETERQPAPPVAFFRPRKGQPTVTIDGQMYYRFKSAGYHATAQRLGITVRPNTVDGWNDEGFCIRVSDGYFLTPEEYDQIARVEARRRQDREARISLE